MTDWLVEHFMLLAVVANVSLNTFKENCNKSKFRSVGDS